MLTYLEDKWHTGGSTASEDDGINGHSLGRLPLGMDDGTLLGRSTEAGVGVGSRGWVAQFPRVAQPVGDTHVVLSLDLLLQSLNSI